MQHIILHHGFPTPTDSEYYSRWEELGGVFIWPPGGEIPFGVPEKSVDILVVDHTVNVDKRMVSRLSNLKYICTPNTSLEHIQVSGFELINLKLGDPRLEAVRSVSEFTLLLILRLARPGYTFGSLLSGKFLGIVGHGRIGKQVRNLAEAFWMDVCHVDKNYERFYWEILFRQADFISIHLPADNSTRNIISKDLISLMKPSAYLINTSRGSVIDEDALRSALVSKRIAGAALDVVGDIKRINGIPNLIVTDHVAGKTIEDRIRTDKMILTDLKSALGIESDKPQL